MHKKFMSGVENKTLRGEDDEVGNEGIEMTDNPLASDERIKVLEEGT